MSERSLRILCVDDHVFLAEGVKARLDHEQDMEVVGWIDSADAILDTIRDTRPDIVLMDVEMPGRDPFEALADMHRRHPHVRIIILSAYVRDHYIDAAVRAGAWGYLSKSDTPDDLVRAIRTVAGGAFALGPNVLQRTQFQRRSGRAGLAPSSRLDELTPRQMQILRMVARGMSRLEIARSIHRSPKTVDNHRAAIMKKLGIHDRVELARFALREGLAETG